MPRSDPIDRAPRTVDAPAAEWLTEDEFARWLGITVQLFRERLKEGLIPAPKKYTGKARLWHWEVVVWVSQGVKLGLWPPEPPENRAAGSQEIEG